MLRASENPLVFAERVLGIQPHEQQAAYLLDTHPVRVVIAGRQGGKSTGNACDLAFRAVRAAIKGNPFKALLSAPTTSQAKITFDVTERLIRASPLGGLITRSVTSPFPLLELGTHVSITARPASAVYLRGFTYSCAYVDECGFIPDSIILEVIMPLLAREGAPLTCTSTPSVRGSWLHQVFERGQRGTDSSVRSFTYASAANPFLDRTFIERQRSELTREQWETEWEGRWVEPVDACFAWSDIMAAATAELGHQGDGGRYVAGLDPARRRDRSALIVLDASTSPRRVAHIEDLAHHSYPEQAERVASVMREYRVQKLAVDATGVGGAVVELLRAAGVAGLEPVTVTASRKVDLLTGLVAAIERRDVVFPSHTDLISELRWLRVIRGQGGQPRYEAAQGHDDYAFALSLALMASGGAAPRRHPASLGLPPFITGSTLAMARGAVISAPGGLPDDDWGPPF